MDVTRTDMGNRPLSVKEISDRAKEYEWNPLIPFKYWARAVETIHHESQVYLREGNLAQAYLFLLRYSLLVLEQLDKHPQAKDPESRRAMKPLKKRIPEVIGLLEEIRPQLDESYNEWLRITASQREQARDEPRSSSRASYAKHAANDPALSWNHVSRAKVLDAGEHQQLAVDLAKIEMRRRRREAGLSEEDEQRRRGAGVWGGWDSDAHGPGDQFTSEQEVRRQMEASRRQLDQTYSTRLQDSRSRRSDEDGIASVHYSYPSINKSTPLQYERQERQSSPIRRNTPSVQPPRPPKHVFDATPYVSPPPVPGKEPIGAMEWGPSSPAEEEAPVLPPKVADSPQQQHKKITFRPAAYLENGEPIRPVFLPSMLRKKFLEIASDNTRRRLEMCGILCGTPVNNALFISCLLIPEQKCTSDTCETENESAMLDYCIEQNLLVVGWIHTHPTQTCFMSSRDLHTQAGYQVMMPESIAIVCAPRYEPSWGIYRLTNPPGLPHILQCQQSETFHQHSIDDIYTDAVHPPGHVYESKSLEFFVHDLRPGFKQ
ncbi:hypothetical protein QBC46DRAFT_388473 [Diplogelasinospora grovesii]|uniref:MPN domain-containing protein n=1 Tax=Diplogelasinospora grovesii TaxID=303347 RepID=A0AAN6N6B5_9PEZI|nr:hypothetical protein QBC46DRAFT_388473 [Diplogelasinospora grovesii]